ncbi:MAG TPA: hypothetical protein VHM91_14685 [Verrucomicrobiales bacterium]|jgi:hypothetical protein|nr:hypothetical protein [Verrucomicrobiales bacterium]
MSSLKSCFASIASLGLLAVTASAANIVVNDFQPLPAGATTPDVWYLNDMRGAGTATIQDLTGLGGNLENNQPLPTGAAKLTTGAAGGDKSEIATFANLGLASSVLNSIQLSYDYYKASSGDAAPAPSIKLIILNSATNSAGNDDYGMLVYEPYLNHPGIGNPATDLWTSVSINSSTGSGDLGSGGWWWTGGFNIPSSAGGPPNRSLAEWLAAFQSADASDFAGASVVGIAMGVGSNNLNQVGYVDNVHVQVPSTAPDGGVNKTYDFQAAAVPEGGSNLGMLAMGLAGIFGYRLFKSKSRRV